VLGVTPDEAYCRFPMPFENGAVLRFVNGSGQRVERLLVRLAIERPARLPPDWARFHATWTEQKAYGPEFANARRYGKQQTPVHVALERDTGPGKYVGLLLHVGWPYSSWWGEGDWLIWTDEDGWPPSYHGTGSEEIFGGGACPNVEYAGPYTGFHLVSSKDFAGKQSMYRFHVTDPVRFRKSIRVTLEHGHANDLGNDYSSTAFWYQAEPHGKFPRLLKWKDRLPRCDDELMTVYRKELETYSVIARMGGVYAFLETVSEEDKAQIQKHSSAVNEEIQKKDYDAALKSVGAIHEVLKKYDR